MVFHSVLTSMGCAQPRPQPWCRRLGWGSHGVGTTEDMTEEHGFAMSAISDGTLHSSSGTADQHGI